MGAPINRDELARIVHGDATKMANLENILQPALAEHSIRCIEQAQTNVVVYVGAKLIESGSPEVFNALWVVVAERESLMSRMAKRDGISAVDAARKVDAQSASQMSKIARASFVIRNNNDDNTDELRAQLLRAWALVPCLGGLVGINGIKQSKHVIGRLIALDASMPHCELSDGARMTFGRDEQCTVVVSDVTVSHLQCRIKCKNGSVFLRGAQFWFAWYADL
jgi:hypothetical protein